MTSTQSAKPSILVLSSHSRPSTSGPINHQIYCQQHGYAYLFDATPYPCASPYDQKLAAVIANLRRMQEDWLVWIDDDAFFMQMERGLEGFIADAGDADIVICKSPVNQSGGWSAINSGVFFVRRSERAIAILEEALTTPMVAVETWWRPADHGHFVKDGDQERMLYVFETNGLIGNEVIIHDHTAFNSRSYHFQNRPDEQFVCHLANNRDKAIPFQEMRARFGLSRFLTRSDDGAEAYAHSMFDVDPQPKEPAKVSMHSRLRRKAAGLLSAAR